MSGVELVGVLASASQIIQEVAKIIKYVRNLQTVIPSFQEHKLNLEALAGAATTIRQTPSLQTATIERLLQLLLDKVNRLTSTLDLYCTDLPEASLKRLWRRLSASKIEDHILKQLAVLEREKTSLLLCINPLVGNSLSGCSAHRFNMAPTHGSIICEGETGARYKGSETVLRENAVRSASGRSTNEVQAPSSSAQTKQSRQAADQHAQAAIAATDGDVYLSCTAGIGGSTFNHGGGPKTLVGGRRNLYDRNCAGDNGKVFNGNFTSEELKAFMKS